MNISAGLRAALAAFTLLCASSTMSIAQNNPPSSQSSTVDDIDPARLEAAREVLRRTNAEKMLSETYPIIVKQTMSSVVALVQPPNLNEEQKAQYIEIVNSISDLTTEFMLSKKSELLSVSAAVYARSFTVEELEALAEFYGKPAGQRFVSATPELMQEIMPLMINILFDKPVEIAGEIPADALEAAKEMMIASKTEEMLDVALAQLSQNPPVALPDGDQDIDEDAKKYAADMTKKFQERRGELVNAMAAIWAKKFTVEEMKAVTEFYQSDAGQKIITSMPQMMTELQTASQSFYQQLSGEMVNKIQTLMKEKGMGPQ